ncbi:hypothetical protein M514_27938 [Trichuris suis]|uniref:Uncharacterized protein n=1 Tax=Trichuris suis TaxID=68888 RepID=A0A085MRP4_9BILA|nr:hypothetical protein M514_27938 [Trichuris suis]
MFLVLENTNTGSCFQVPIFVFSSTDIRVFKYRYSCFQVPIFVFSSTDIRVFKYRYSCFQVPIFVFSSTDSPASPCGCRAKKATLAAALKSLKAQVATEEARLAEMKSKTWGLTLGDDGKNRFIVLPDGTDFDTETPWTWKDVRGKKSKAIRLIQR